MAQETEVASLIKKLRTQKGESLRSAARNIGVDVAHLARIESGERQLSGPLGQRVSSYYDIHPDTVELAAGRLPSDVIELLLAHPEEIDKLRNRYGSDA